jgi:hypothetical protein
MMTNATLSISLSILARVACTMLGETGTYEQEYQDLLAKLRAQVEIQR